MPKTLFRNARLIDPEAQTERRGHLVTADGTVRALYHDDAPSDFTGEVVDCTGLCLAPGIVDIGVKICEPGARHKESFRSAGEAAAAGGVTTIVTRADTDPVIDTPEGLEFVIRRARAEACVHVLPMAALTKGHLGREMTEIGFLMDAGAVAFSDGDAVVADTRVLARALSYARAMGALVIGHVQEPALSQGAVATSGKFATLLGLPGVSAMAERIGIERAIALAEMTGVRFHIDQITTACALPALQRARQARHAITAGISIHHLTLNALDIADYRTFFKLTPPLRDESDRLAMVEALRGGLIDIIASFHTPQDEESKRLPFEIAASGAVGLETLLPAALRLVHAGVVTLPALWRALSCNPARLLGLPCGRLSPGAPADLVLFDPDAPFVLDRAQLRSKSRNTPFDGTLMQGKVKATYLAGQRVFGTDGP